MNRNTTAAVKTLPLCDVIRRLIENGALVKAEEVAAKAMWESFWRRKTSMWKP